MGHSIESNNDETNSSRDSTAPEDSSSDPGKRACMCIKFGTRCWESLAGDTTDVLLKSQVRDNQKIANVSVANIATGMEEQENAEIMKFEIFAVSRP